MESKNLCSKIIVPFCPIYPEARQVFNRAVQKCPSSIVYCENKEDVRQAVCHAVKCGQSIRIRSGGHNYEGFCIGNNKMTIDTSQIKKIQIDADTLKIGSGITNRELYGFLRQYDYPFPSGTCPTVSAAGLTLGGGWGHSARMLGLACDSLAEAELIDGKGRVITASEASHPGLFWALRGGGGGNFGVLTSLTYHLVPNLCCVTYINIQYPDIEEATASCFLKTWQAWTETEEIRFTPNSRIYNSEKEGMGIYLRGFFYGSPAEAESVIRPFTDIKGAEAELKYVTFWEATEIDASFYPPSEKFRFAGRFTHRRFTGLEIQTILQLIKCRAVGASYASVALYALGGKVRDKDPCSTAFFYRNASFIIGIETVWEDASFQCENSAWIESRFQCLYSLTSGSYINFPYLCTTDYMRAYYGGNAERLADVKQQYDPDNLFCFPQSIRC